MMSDLQASPTHLADLEALYAEAAEFTHNLTPSGSHATLVTLSGELGAGKTSFTQGIAHALGIEEPIASPTFVLEKIYDLPAGKAFAKLVHIDAYRLEGDRSFAPLGFDELYTEPSNLIVIEWPELVESQLPDADEAVALSVNGDGRDISYA